jgi:hypothetical protein
VFTPGLDSPRRDDRHAVRRPVPHPPELRQDVARLGEFAVAEIVHRQLLLIQQRAEFVIEALRAERFDESFDVRALHDSFL